jgi:hypothetical protein
MQASPCPGMAQQRSRVSARPLQAPPIDAACGPAAAGPVLGAAHLDRDSCTVWPSPGSGLALFMGPSGGRWLDARMWSATPRRHCGPVATALLAHTIHQPHPRPPLPPWARPARPAPCPRPGSYFFITFRMIIHEYQNCIHLNIM